MRTVALFKDYLIYDDRSCECLKQYYDEGESKDRLAKLTDFYNTYSEIFPSYSVLIQPMYDEKTLLFRNKEGVAKYMFKNIKRKQKMIDEKFCILAKKKQK